MDIMGLSLVISLFIFPLDFLNHFAHYSIICVRERFFVTFQEYIFALLNRPQRAKRNSVF